MNPFKAAIPTNLTDDAQSTLELIRVTLADTHDYVNGAALASQNAVDLIAGQVAGTADDLRLNHLPRITTAIEVAAYTLAGYLLVATIKELFR